MFVSDLRTGFHDALCKQTSRVLLLVAQDVDALCACRILQKIFQCENILYTLVPVSCKTNLEEVFKLHGEHIKHVVMVNCGATLDIVSLLQPKEGVIFFIGDSHRPIHVNNIYNGTQVRLLMKQSEKDTIPDFEDIFRDESEDEEEDVIDDAYVERRRQRRLWEEKRMKILFDYTQFSYYGPSSAVLLYDLAWKLSKDSSEVLWWAIVGLTEQFIHGRLEMNQYPLEVGNLQGHVTRHNHQSADDQSDSAECLRIYFEKELQLAMYRHWSLFESLKHTMYTACSLKLWTQKGQKKLYESLALMGLPLYQCKQKYACMDIQLKSNIITWMENLAENEKQNYGQNTTWAKKIVYESFVAQYGYRHKFSAMDLVRACSAILESTDQEKSPSDRFLDALQCLSKKNFSMLERGLGEAKLQLTAIFKQVQTLLDMHGIISAGPFLYAVIQEGTPDACYFSYPLCLSELARFLLNAHVNVSRSKKSRNLPLVLMAPVIEQPNVSLVVGIPPVSEDSQRNFFGKAFEQAALRVKSSVVQDNFDLSFVQILGEEKSQFFDALIALLA